jgi:hypothetical protein
MDTATPAGLFRYSSRMRCLIVRILIVAFLWMLVPSCSNLEIGELAKISYESVGCFGPYKSIITIFEENKSLFARLQSKEGSKVVRIEAADFNKFQRIISRLRDLKASNGCTSSIRYTVYTGIETFVVRDEGCQDIGFEHFQNAIFDDEN